MCSLNGMLDDILDIANESLGLIEKTYDVKEYVSLTDDILSIIEWSKEKELEAARKLITRIKKRDLYLNVGSYNLSSLFVEKVMRLGEDNLALKLISFCHDSPVSHKDFSFRLTKVDYGMKALNPLLMANFYNEKCNTVSFKPSPEDLTR